MAKMIIYASNKLTTAKIIQMYLTCYKIASPVMKCLLSIFLCLVHAYIAPSIYAIMSLLALYRKQTQPKDTNEHIQEMTSCWHTYTK